MPSKVVEEEEKLGKKFHASSDAKLNAPKPLDAKQWDNNGTVYKASNGVTVFQKEPLSKDQLEDAKFVYKVAGGSVVVPTEKQYPTYAAAHPDERIASIPAATESKPNVALADHVTGKKHDAPKRK